MPRIYTYLTTQERAVVMTMCDDQCSIWAIAKCLCHAPISISRELRRAPVKSNAYDANLALLQSQARRVTLRRVAKLRTDGHLFLIVRHGLNLLWLPQQIANILKAMWPDDSDKTVSHETIYNAIYLHPRGELKREMIACLRHHDQVRKPRSRGAVRRGQIKDMQSDLHSRSGPIKNHAVHIRPPEIEDCIIPCHLEGDLFKGEDNRSSVGTLVERTTHLVVLAKMDNAGTRSVIDSISAMLNRQPARLRKSMTYDQGREMHDHKILAERTGVQIYFADPHSPWQRGSNENTNDLLRQYTAKGSDLSIY